jgi:hypothetical protein
LPQGGRATHLLILGSEIRQLQQMLRETDGIRHCFHGDSPPLALFGLRDRRASTTGQPCETSGRRVTLVGKREARVRLRDLEAAGLLAPGERGPSLADGRLAWLRRR